MDNIAIAAAWKLFLAPETCAQAITVFVVGYAVGLLCGKRFFKIFRFIWRELFQKISQRDPVNSLTRRFAMAIVVAGIGCSILSLCYNNTFAVGLFILFISVTAALYAFFIPRFHPHSDAAENPDKQQN